MVVVLLLGFLLRYDEFRTIPRHGATFDEFAWTWQGISLIQEGIPISWSPQPQYSNKEEIRYQGAAFLIVKPYLEHPPLFGLTVGSFALLNGVKDMYDVTLAKIRPLALGLGILGILGIFILAKEIYGNSTAFLASLLYATIPTITIGSRIIQNENFLIPFWLTSLFLIIKYLKTGKQKFRNLAAIIAGSLSLAKAPWLVVGLSLSMILSYKNRWKDALTVMGIVAVFFSLFLVYGFYFDKDLFVNLWTLQLARYDIHFAGIFSLFTNPLLVDRFYLDGWIFFGWFAIVLLSKEFKKHFLILIPFISYFILYLFAIPDEPMHGWYRYPFYPFLVIASALVIKEEISKISLVSLFFLFLVGLSLMSNTWETMFGFSYFAYRLFIILISATVLIILWFPALKSLSGLLLKLWLSFFIFLNIIATINYLD